MKKSLLALLLALNTIAPAAETTTTIPETTITIPEVVIPEEPSKTNSKLLRTIARVALLFTLKNACNRYLSYKGKTFNFANYAMHGATFGIDTLQPSTDSSKAAEIAEWLAKEVSFVNDETDKTSKARTVEFALNFDAIKKSTALDKVFCKAISRKKLFLSKENAVRKFMDDEVINTLMPLIESAPKFKVSTEKDASWQAKVPYNFTQLDNVQAVVRTAIGRKAGEYAELLLIGVSTSPSCPEAFNKFIETQEGFALAKNILGQIIEDSIDSVVYVN